MTEDNAAAISDSDGGNAVSADDADDAVDAVIGIVGTISDGDAGVISTYY